MTTHIHEIAVVTVESSAEADDAFGLFKNTVGAHYATLLQGPFTTVSGFSTYIFLPDGLLISEDESGIYMDLREEFMGIFPVGAVGMLAQYSDVTVTTQHLSVRYEQCEHGLSKELCEDPITHYPQDRESMF